MRKAIIEVAKKDPLPEEWKRGECRGRFNGQNPGLLLQRWLAVQSPADGNNSPGANEQKRAAIADRRALLAATEVACQNSSLRGLYEAAYTRWNKFPKDELNPCAELGTIPKAGRLIVGLGSENVLETGIRLHHTYGVPLIPGSALKGLAAHYCHEVWGEMHSKEATSDSKRYRRPSPAEDKEYRKFLGGAADRKSAENYYRLLFGNTDDGGVIAFHDAWITPKSLMQGALSLDVMTPHHSDFQRGPNDEKSAAPTDFDSPVPVSFLSVAGTFQVRLSWAGPANTPLQLAKDWTTRAFEILKNALADWGIGGKTSSGYGRLIAPTGFQVTPSGSAAEVASYPRKSKALPKTWEVVEARIVPDTKGQGRFFARHEESGLVGPILKPEDLPEQERQPETALKLIVAMISTDGKQIQFLYPTPANQQRAQQAKQPPSRGKPPGNRGKR